MRPSHPTPRHPRRGVGARALLGAVILGVAISLAGCAGAEGGHPSPTATGPRSLTTDEAQRLAVVRFTLYQAKLRAVDATIVMSGGSVTLRGWLDSRDQDGYALVTPEGDPAGAFLTNWTTSTVSAEPYTGSTPPLPVPGSGWESSDLTAGSSPLAAAQLLLVGLSSDRPDNPQLLLQGHAQWVRSDEVDGVHVDVISGPVTEGATTSNLRYWIDARGRLLRLEARLDAGQWSTFDFSDAPGVTL